MASTAINITHQLANVDRVGRSWASALLPLVEHAELRGVAARLGEAEMAERMAGQEASARSALEEALLDQERLDDLLDGVARLRQRRGDGLDADRAAAVIHRDRREIAPVHGVEAAGIDLEGDERVV